DVLLAAPLTGADLLQQKMAGVWRLIAVLLVPFGTIGAFQLWFRGFNIGYLLGYVMVVLILLPLIAWMALAVGLRIRGTMKAILMSVGIIVVVCCVPIILASVLFPSIHGPLPPVANLLASLSPYRQITLLESYGGSQDHTELKFWLGLLPLTLFAGLLWWVRRNCLLNADRLLQRVPEEPLLQR